MPRQTEERLKGREPITAKETFRYTTPDLSVTAKPVDAYAAPAKPKDTDLLLNAMDSFFKAGDVTAKAIDEKARYDEEQGKSTAAAGQPLKEGVSGAWAAGWYKVKGKADTFDLEKEAQDYLLKNQGLDKDQFETGWNNIIRSKLDGKPKAYAEGFLGRALEIESSVYHGYQTHQHKLYKESSLANQSKILSGIIAKTSEPQDIRDAITELQQEGKRMGFTTQEVSENAYAVLLSQARLSDNKRLLEAAYIPDKSGISLAYSIGADKVENDIYQIGQRQQQRIDIERKNKAYDIKENTDKFGIDFMKKHQTAKSLEDIEALEKSLLDNIDNIDPDAARTYAHMIDAKKGKGEHPVATTDTNIYLTALGEAKAGNLSQKQLLDLRTKLSEADYNRVVSAYAEDLDRSRSKPYAEYKNKREEFRNSTIQAAAPTDMFGNFGENDGPAKRREATTLWQNLEDDALAKAKKEGRETLTTQELIGISDEVVKRVTGNDPAKPAGNAAGKPAPAAKPEEQKTKDKVEQRLKMRQESKVQGTVDLASYGSSSGKGVSALHPNAIKHSNTVREAISVNGLKPEHEDVILAMMSRESAGNSKAVSPKGASGLMQLMPGTARDMGVTDIFDEKQNIHGGVKYFAKMLKRYHDSIPLALAAYNAGPEAVDKYDGIPPFDETQQYVINIMNRLEKIKRQRVRQTV